MLPSAFERIVALRYLRARRREGFVSVITGFSFLGIMLGVATLIIVMSVMNGFRTQLLTRVLGLNGHVRVVAEGARPLADFDALAARLRAVPGITHARPIVDGQGMAMRSGAATGIAVRGIRPADLAARSIIAGNIVSGSLEDFNGRSDIVIGARLAARFGLGPGARLSIATPRSAPTAFGSVPRIKSFRVAAIFNVGMFEYDSSFVFMPLDAARVFFETGEGVSAIELATVDADRIAQLRAPLTEALAGAPALLVDWRQLNGSFFNALQVERNVMFLILTLIIVIAAFNVISGLIMLVKEKGRDIAILRTMGATRGMIMRIFFMTGAAVGVTGTAAGFVLGVLFARNIETIRGWIEGLTGTNLFAAEIYFLSRLPSEINNLQVGLVVAMALALSLLATLYPSWRAARLDPVEALRYE